MKRFISSLLAVFVCVPLLSLSVFADTLDMNTVIKDELLPAGYVYPTIPKLTTLDKNELIFYDAYFGMYYLISFNGGFLISNNSDQYTNIKFDDVSSVSIRAYPCEGKDVFSLSKDLEFNVHVPPQTLTTTASEMMNSYFNAFGVNNIDNLVWKYSYGRYDNEYLLEKMYTEGHPYYSFEYRYTRYDGKYMLDKIIPKGIGSNGNIDMHGDIYSNIPDLTTIIPALDIPVEIKDLSLEHLDYYRVPKYDDVITTSIDYSKKWNQGSTWAGDCIYIGDFPLIGFLVSINSNYHNNKVADFRFNTGSYYNVFSYVNIVTLVNSEKLINYPKLPLKYLNKMLTHFNIEPVFYSSSNDKLSNDIGGLGTQMGGWNSQAAGFQQQAGQAVSGVSASVAKFNPLFMGVWNILPPWFMALLAVSLIIVIGRKILGR